MIARIAVAAGLLMALGAAQAQAPAVLIEACNAISEPEKRLECLKAAMGAGSAAAQAQPLAVVSRAFSGMEASLNAGISYNNYQIAVLDLAKAVSAFKQDAGEAGAAATKLFESAVEAYSDAGALWERSISFYARRGNDIAYAGGLPVSMNGLDWLVSKYSLATGKSDIWGLERGLPVQPARAEIWRIAKEKAEAASKAYGKKLEAAAQPESAKDPNVLAVEEAARQANCSEDPAANQTGVIGATRLFSVYCSNRQTMSFECLDGACKRLN